MKDAYFAGGCFWCMARPYYDYDGVLKVVSGYMGGNTPNPSYETVKTGNSNYKETIKITYDEEKITYKELLDIYFLSIDPFDDGGQYQDRGDNYRCVCFFTDDFEKSVIEEKINNVSLKFNKKCTVEISKVMHFYEAEEYHQDYHLKNPFLFEKEMSSSGRKMKPLIGRFSFQNNYYEIEVFNNKVISAREIEKYDIYDNPKSIHQNIKEIYEGLEKIKDTLDFLDKDVTIEIDRKIGTVHPKHSDIVYPINYGFVPYIIGGDGEELDAYVLGESTPLEIYKGRCLGLIHRLDEEDDKLILGKEELLYSKETIRKVTFFQEKFHTSILIMASPKKEYEIRKMTFKEAKEYLQWEYKGDLEDYNITSDIFPYVLNETIESIEKGNYYSVLYKDKIIGIYAYHFFEDEMYIGLGLNPDYVRYNFGHDFVLNCIKFGRSEYNYQGSINLMVRESNKVAIKVYEELGFKEYKKGPCTFYNKIISYVFMRKE